MFNIIHALNLNISPGLNGIPLYFARIAADVIAVPLLMPCNLSFSKRIFPECMKSAKVMPLFKSGCRIELTNYRPILLLSCLSKVFEKLIYVTLMNYLTFFVASQSIWFSSRPFNQPCFIGCCDNKL